MKARISEFELDSTTLQRLQSRDPAFLAELFTEVNPFLMRICITNGFYMEAAEEVIHDTWERFFTNLEKFEGRSQIRTFICGILFNKIREHRRSDAKTQLNEDSEDFMNSAFTPEGWWKVEPHSPQKILELKQSASLVQECLGGLTEQQQAAFVLREVEDEDNDKICETLQVNITHLRVLLFRAKDKLRKCLEGKLEAGAN